MKHIIKLTNYHPPEELNKEISKFVEYYNHNGDYEGILAGSVNCKDLID